MTRAALALGLIAAPALAQDYPYPGDWALVPDGSPTVEVDCTYDFVRIYPDGLTNQITGQPGSYTPTDAWICGFEAEGQEVCTGGEGADHFYTYAPNDRTLVSCEYPDRLRANFTELLNADPPQMIYNPCVVFRRCPADPARGAAIPRLEASGGSGFFQ